MDHETPFYTLSPDTVINAVESAGYLSDLRILPLNSYENRVYQVGIEDEEPLIAKFYRPNRWNDSQILEEHAFCFELAEAGIPVIAPIKNTDDQSLFFFKDFRFSLFKRQGGHALEFDDDKTLVNLGTVIARIHSVGHRYAFQVRPRLSIEEFATHSFDFILSDFMPDELKQSYQSLGEDIIKQLKQSQHVLESAEYLRTHGDCHIGNILTRDGNIHFVDLDDSRMAPAIQDLWMFLSGDKFNQQRQIEKLMEGYNNFGYFPYAQLSLIEVLRTLRIMHYSAWLARRWQDPAFQQHFPWFNSVRYWSDHILSLREQLSALQDSPLNYV